MYDVSFMECNVHFCVSSFHKNELMIFEDLQKINSVLHYSYCGDYYYLCFLVDNAKWHKAFRQSYGSRFHPLTAISAIISIFCEPSYTL